MVYSGLALEEDRDVTWILMVMLGLIAGSIVIEWVLPQKIKDAAGAAICWTLMAITMTFLGAATLGLLWATWTQYLQPFLSA